MKIAVVIPCFKVKDKILPVLEKIPSAADKIYVVDDACPQKSGTFVKEHCKDPRVEVLFQAKNSGVGGATIAGFEAAYKNGFSIAVKIDGDGQMDPLLLPQFVAPILSGQADYTKGNRFYSPRALSSMPLLRLLGNAALSFLAKITNGYWQVMDPTNGYIAIHTKLIPWLDGEKVSQRYFFENDMLFRLGILRAVVVDIPMKAHYADEKSGLSIYNTLITFPGKFLVRFFKRISYCYFIRDFNIASLFLVCGTLLVTFGNFVGSVYWKHSISSGEFTSSGTVMLAALPIILGAQFFLFALQYDVLMQPKNPIHPQLPNFRAEP